MPRVLIVDIDAHHGKSTQDIFYGDGSVFYFSIHQEGVHPGTGRFAERGREPGAVHTVNVPSPALSGDRVYTEVYQLVLQPILDGLQRELILVRLGLDGYCQDNSSQLTLNRLFYSFPPLLSSDLCTDSLKDLRSALAGSSSQAGSRTSSNPTWRESTPTCLRSTNGCPLRASQALRGDVPMPRDGVRAPRRSGSSDRRFARRRHFAAPPSMLRFLRLCDVVVESRPRGLHAGRRDPSTFRRTRIPRGLARELNCRRRAPSSHGTCGARWRCVSD